MFDGGDPAKVDDISLESLQASSFPRDEINRFPQSPAALPAALFMAVQDHELRSAADGQGVKGPLKSSFHGQVCPSGSAPGADPLVLLFDHMMVDCAASIFSLQVMVARQAHRMVKVTGRRHGRSPLVWDVSEDSTRDTALRRLFQPLNRGDLRSAPPSLRRRISDVLRPRGPFSARRRSGRHAPHRLQIH